MADKDFFLNPAATRGMSDRVGDIGAQVRAMAARMAGRGQGLQGGDALSALIRNGHELACNNLHDNLHGFADFLDPLGSKVQQATDRCQESDNA